MLPPRDGCSAFPTDVRERAKTRKQDGHTPVKKKQVVEHHLHDLGDVLTGFGDEVMSLMKDVGCSLAPTPISQEAASHGCFQEEGRLLCQVGPACTRLCRLPKCSNTCLQTGRVYWLTCISATSAPRHYTSARRRAPWPDKPVLEPQPPIGRGAPGTCSCHGKAFPILLDNRYVTPTYAPVLSRKPTGAPAGSRPDSSGHILGPAANAACLCLHDGSVRTAALRAPPAPIGTTFCPAGSRGVCRALEARPTLSSGAT